MAVFYEILRKYGNKSMDFGRIDPRIVHFTDSRIMDPRGKVVLDHKEFHQARNSVLNVCRNFGTIGAMYEFPLDSGLTEKEADIKWKSTGIKHPDFYILDDQLNYERYIYVEINNGHLLSMAWIFSIIECLNGLSGWGVGITNVNQGYILIFRDLILVNGSTFELCTDIDSVLTGGRVNIRFLAMCRGPVAPQVKGGRRDLIPGLFWGGGSFCVGMEGCVWGVCRCGSFTVAVRGVVGVSGAAL